MVSKDCYLCLSSTNTIPCHKCGKVSMCKDDRKRHMDKHGRCYPYKVQYDCEMGRYLVATENIKQGEIILHEDPLVLGPYTRSKPQCLNCFKVINSKTRYDCSKCGFPACDEKCVSGRYRKDECEIFANIGFKAFVSDTEEFNKNYSAVTVLRLLLVMEKEEMMISMKKGKKEECTTTAGIVSNMMDHNEERMTEQPDVWKFEKEFIIDFLIKVT